MKGYLTSLEDWFLYCKDQSKYDDSKSRIEKCISKVLLLKKSLKPSVRRQNTFNKAKLSVEGYLPKPSDISIITSEQVANKYLPLVQKAKVGSLQTQYKGVQDILAVLVMSNVQRQGAIINMTLKEVSTAQYSRSSCNNKDTWVIQVWHVNFIAVVISSPYAPY